MVWEVKDQCEKCRFGLIIAFDSPTYTIDISPFIPTLTDSLPHNFTLTVEGQGADRSAGSEWLFSGSIFTTKFNSGERTTGKINSYHVHSDINVSRMPSDAGNRKNSVGFVVDAVRKIEISSTLETSTSSRLVTFSQHSRFRNRQSVADSGKYQHVEQIIHGSIESTMDGETVILQDTFTFPMNLLTTVVKDSRRNQTIVNATLSHSYFRSTSGPAGFSPTGLAQIDTTQNATGQLIINSKGRASSGVGRTRQSYEYKNGNGDEYFREIEIFNVTQKIKDVERGNLAQAIKPVTTGIQDGDGNNYDNVNGMPFRCPVIDNPNHNGLVEDRGLFLQLDNY